MILLLYFLLPTPYSHNHLLASQNPSRHQHNHSHDSQNHFFDSHNRCVVLYNRWVDSHNRSAVLYNRWVVLYNRKIDSHIPRFDSPIPFKSSQNHSVDRQNRPAEPPHPIPGSQNPYAHSPIMHFSLQNSDTDIHNR